MIALIYLPAGSGGSKVGVDDYLAAGHSTEDLLALATLHLREAPADEDADGAHYRMTDSGIVWRKATANGPVDVPVTNFKATIAADVLEDDGAETRRLFEIEASLGGRISRFRVSAAQFNGMGWVVEHIGAGAVVYAGFGTKDHAHVAIQLLSDEIPQRQVFTHVGWREIDGCWLYLHAVGAIGADGPVNGIEVKLSGPLARFELPDPPSDAALVESVRASLDLLRLAPMTVTAPVIGAVYLAPLRELLGKFMPDLTVWEYGPSGALKSELAALAQGHYGPFTRLNLPATFSSTANSIERLTFVAKDALITIDDYHPALNKFEEQTMAQVASRLLRGVGNSSGRQRMRADTTLRPELPPQCVVLATGERLPPGHSTGARMFPVVIKMGDIDKAKLSQAQDRPAALPLAMAGYVHWLAARWDQLHTALPSRFRELREQAQVGSGHAREPGQVAHLYLGLETLLAFAVDIGAVARDEADDLLNGAWRALLGGAAEHREGLESETPAARFVALLSDGFASKQAYLEDMRGGAPGDAEDWGWERRSWTDGRGELQHEIRHPPTAALLGRVDNDWLYLYPEAAYQFLTKAAAAGGRVFPVDLRTLRRSLDEAGLIQTEAKTGNRTVKQRFGEKTLRVIRLRRDALRAITPSAVVEQMEQVEHDASSDSEHSDWEADAASCVPPVPPKGVEGAEMREVLEL